MDIDHVHTEGCGGAHRSGYRVGNVVELQVEEDGMAALEQRFKDGGTSGREELHTYLKPAADILEPVGEGSRRGCVGNIKGHDEALARLFEWLRPVESDRQD
jgi:hypothetical protein